MTKRGNSIERKRRSSSWKVSRKFQAQRKRLKIQIKMVQKFKLTKVLLKAKRNL